MNGSSVTPDTAGIESSANRMSVLPIERDVGFAFDARHVGSGGGEDLADGRLTDTAQLPELGKRDLELHGSLVGVDASAARAGQRPSLADLVDVAGWRSDAGLYACLATVDMFKLTQGDFVDHLDNVLTVGEFYELAAGGEIIFT